MSGFRRDELYAAAVVEHVLGASVVQLDVPGAPRKTIDGEIRYGDGRRAGLEVTSVEDSSEHHLRAKLKTRPSAPAPGRLTWTIHAPSVRDLARLEKLYERVIALAERHNVTRPEDLPLDVIHGDPELEWLAWEVGPVMWGYLPSGKPKVYWMPPVAAAIFSSEGEAIAEGVDAALQVDPARDHIAKLLAAPYDERHLFLIVGTTGLSNAAAYALIEPSEVPSEDPALPVGIDHLWLAPGWGQTVTVWSRPTGWRHERLPDPPRSAERSTATR